MKTELEVLREDLRSNHPPARLLAIENASSDIIKTEIGADLICNVVKNDPDDKCRFRAVHRLWGVINQWNIEIEESPKKLPPAEIIDKFLFALRDALFTGNYDTTKSAIDALGCCCRLVYSLPKPIKDKHFPPGQMILIVNGVQQCASRVSFSPNEIFLKCVKFFRLVFMTNQ